MSNHSRSITQPTRAKHYGVIASGDTTMTQPTGESGYLHCSTGVVSYFQANLNVDIEMRQWRHQWSLITESFPYMELPQDIPDQQGQNEMKKKAKLKQLTLQGNLLTSLKPDKSRKIPRPVFKSDRNPLSSNFLSH